MFTIEQIKTAHSKVKTGKDFPMYIQEIKSYGVTGYEAYVSDGHLTYFGENDYIVNIPPKYENLAIADSVNSEEFRAGLLAHQEGKSDFFTFISMCATFGIEKWIINMKQMTCAYYDKSGNKILMEKIPSINLK